jgi:aspartyl-tRNA(Asn)/glutamyl-tRNA(Gln) amidotransferase subunit B
MQNGNLRADVNVSVCAPGQYEKYQATQDFSHLGTRCEIKNMNSMRFIQLAIDYEARRQIAILEDGGKVVQETRLYDPDRNETRSMRSKEEAHDYRYFPCPDLLPLEIEQAWVDEIAATMPELPDAKKARFMGDFGLTDYNASVLTAELHYARYFEEVVAELTKQGFDPAAVQSVGHTVAHGVSNMIVNELFGALKTAQLDIDNSPIKPVQLAKLVAMMRSGEISSKMAKDLFEILWTEGGDPAEQAAKHGMKQETDTGAIEKALDDLIAANPDQVEKAKVNAKLAGWFTGQVLKATGGKANPAVVNAMVAQKLGL